MAGVLDFPGRFEDRVRLFREQVIVRTGELAKQARERLRDIQAKVDATEGFLRDEAQRVEARVQNRTRRLSRTTRGITDLGDAVKDLFRR